jgi:hypothetical protein
MDVHLDAMLYLRNLIGLALPVVLNIRTAFLRCLAPKIYGMLSE